MARHTPPAPVLIPGTKYYVRVSAYNSLGNGVALPTSPAFAIPTTQVPSQPTDMSLAVASATALQAAWQQPTIDGGLSFGSTKIEWDTKNTFDSKQTIQVFADNTISSGSFKLSFGTAADASQYRLHTMECFKLC